MDSTYVQSDLWSLQPCCTQDFKQFPNLAASPTSSTTSSSTSTTSSPGSVRDDKIRLLDEARKQRRRDQNKAAQRKFRQRKQQTETNLQSEIENALKEINHLQEDNDRLVQELCDLQKENVLQRSRQGDMSSRAARREYAELEAIAERLVESRTEKQDGNR